ncbi:hypothetical protein [Lysobacter enzymogenes]|uniref:hypothetical protein n=1 Tax=Lysobacter enzymogenes TaxID=69 RepID=UPI001A96D8EE|nr:hypothetical protein [Lysobacter enzymogenes]QQP95579.1 hypothetical protein JHW38_20470 [Lysobacter enzymogenes]
MDARIDLLFRGLPAARLLALGLALSLAAACTRDPAPAPSAAPAAASPSPVAKPTAVAPVAAAAAQPTAEAGGLRLEPIADVPAPPAEAAAEVHGDCAVAPASVEARAAQARGWKVFGEREWQGYRVVGVAAAPGVLAGMGCTSGGGRLLLFRDGRSVAQVFEPGARAGDATVGVQGFDDGEDAKLRGGDAALGVYDWAVQRARIRADDGTLRLQALPEADLYCGGRAAVPRVEGVALPQARERLLARGWRAAPPQREEPGFVAGMIEAGYPEVEDCAGTGQGFCSFAYRNPAGDRLTLVTAGELSRAERPGDEEYWPHARHAGVACAGQPAAADGE